MPYKGTQKQNKGNFAKGFFFSIKRSTRTQNKLANTFLQNGLWPLLLTQVVILSYPLNRSSTPQFDTLTNYNPWGVRGDVQEIWALVGLTSFGRGKKYLIFT